MTTDAQKSLLDQEPNALGEMLVEHEENKTPPVEPNSTALADLRSESLQVDGATLIQALADFDDRRKTFRDWLKSKLVRGVHFGYPPGTEPKYNDKGEQIVWKRGKGGDKGHWEVLPRESWTLKESLYEAGADFICELMGVRMVVNADQDLWTQAGAMPGNLCFRCQIVSKATGEVIGEGHGGAKVQSNSKTDPLNQAIMMGRKRAKVKAVRDAYALADLFAQDLEDVDHGPADHPAPATNPDSKKDQPRKKRVTAAQLRSLSEAYKAVNQNADIGAYKLWVHQVCLPHDFDAGKQSEWTMIDLEKCSKELGLPQ